MSGYRRFVAYVYEYRQGKKAANCGFVKVEVRNGRCTMDLNLQCLGLAPGAQCRVYGFVRKRGIMNGVLLGSCQTGENKVVCKLETDAQNMGGQRISLEQMGGMVFQTELGAFFGTEWDDAPIRPEDFREKEGAEPESEELQEELKEENAEEDAQEEHREERVDSRRDEEHTEGGEEQGETEGDEGRETEDSGEGESVRDVQAEEVCGECLVPPCKGRTSWQPGDPEEIGEGFQPFGDGEFCICRKIHPQDLMRLSRRECVLRSNRFLSYGYCHFGHLLLAQRRDGQFVLGVPGVYDQQEHFMAKMFGFPYFKESTFIELPNGRGGYWYRLIDSPNAD